ncbi:uncharacterized protein LOC131003808 [Salvia miltiorrhiza]|uniref:uncharacterized protein LOC131003808 n=1 Tax=Salvia miltiorrhiza TaxID=226208 RepID=UPI0025AC7E44|nr:uncharacterized protein LOC131003808 [Salvia miltiorrhiza]
MYYRLRGSESSSFYDGDYYELWVCREEKWEKDFNVSLTSVYAPMTMVDNRFLFLRGLYKDGGGNNIATNHGLSVYDHTRKKCVVLGFTDNVYVFSYVESFVTLLDGKPIQGSDVLNRDISLGNNDNAIESTAEEEEEELEEEEQLSLIYLVLFTN